MDEEEFDDIDVESIVDDEGEMPWESRAREAIEHAIGQAKFDEVRGVIYAPTGEDHRGDEVIEEFATDGDFLMRLEEIGDEEWYNHVPHDEGPVFESFAKDLAYSLADNNGVLAFFAQVRRPDEGEELATAHDLVLPGAGIVLRADLSEINGELIRYLAKHPEKMQLMDPRKFEELVAALFRAKGYDVVLTPKTRDGGLDIRAFHRGPVGLALTLIECKRYQSDRRVSVDVVRGLYGVTESEKATSGLIVTTSSFTKDAKSFQEQNKYRIHLADQQELQKWLQEHKPR